MQQIQQFPKVLANFIQSPEFFQWHGTVLASLWFVAVLLGILARRLSTYLHATCFFIIDVTTLFFLTGAWLRVYPYLNNFDQWSTGKKGHIIGGSIFGVLLIIQHIGGVTTLLKKMKFNSSHRKMAWVVSNLARVVAVYGFILVKQEKLVLYLTIATAVLFIASTYSVFFSKHQKPQKDGEGQHTKVRPVSGVSAKRD